MTIRIEIASQDRMVYEGDADMVLIPGVSGVMGILPNHAPLLSTLGIGIVEVRLEGREQYFTITGGVVDIQPDIVTVLADAAENVQEIDVARAEAARRRAEEILKLGPPPDMDSYLALEAALKRSTLRLDAVRKYRGQRVTYPPMSEE